VGSLVSTGKPASAYPRRTSSRRRPVSSRTVCDLSARRDGASRSI
jgi:hypothetical protein